MYRNHNSNETTHYRRIRPLSDALRRARILRRAADVIETDLHGRPVTAHDVPRLLRRRISERDAQGITGAIRDLRAPGCMGRDAEADWLRGTAHAVITDSRRGGGR